MTTNTGSSASATSVSCHDRSSIATSDALTVTMFDRIDEAVSVSTAWTPPTSFASRDWMAPVFVAVKKPRSIACRCSKRRLRRSAITRLPSRVVR